MKKLFTVSNSKEYKKRAKQSKKKVLKNLKEFVKNFPDTVKFYGEIKENAKSEEKCNKCWQQVRKETAKEIRDKIISDKDMPEPIKNEWKKWFNKEYGIELE